MRAQRRRFLQCAEIRGSSRLRSKLQKALQAQRRNLRAVHAAAQPLSVRKQRSARLQGMPMLVEFHPVRTEFQVPLLRIRLPARREVASSAGTSKSILPAAEWAGIRAAV